MHREKERVTEVVMEGVAYHVHARIIGGFWTGYIIANEDYLCSLPSCTAHHVILERAKDRIRSIIESKRKDG